MGSVRKLGGHKMGKSVLSPGYDHPQTRAPVGVRDGTAA
jgi:hypothetical protein